jgi:hypothetical protein
VVPGGSRGLKKYVAGLFCRPAIFSSAQNCLLSRRRCLNKQFSG